MRIAVADAYLLRNVIINGVVVAAGETFVRSAQQQYSMEEAPG